MESPRKKLAFLLRDDSIRFYREVADHLLLNGYDIFWITNNRMWFNYLKSNWNHSDRLLLIQTNPDSNGPDPSLSLIQDLEANIKEFNLNKWILSDRGLKGVNHQLSIRMLARFANELSSHLKKHHIDYLIGELTFSIELVAYYIARQSGVKFLYPDSIKIPSNRFAFFETPYYGDEFLKKVPKKSHQEEARKVFQKWKESRAKPHFWHLNRKPPRPQWNWIKKYFQWAGESDYIMSNRRLIAAKKLEKIANYLSLKRLPFVRVRDLPKEQKFAIFPLHMQPEASVDITAPEFSNQLATIQNIARCLPYNYSLLVKEHEMALGCRGRSFYKDLLKIPNVILLSPYEDSYSALSRCQIVFAIASTMGFEAALLGIPVITFSRVFYHRLSGVHYCSTPSVLTEVIKDALLNHTFDQEEAINFLAQLLANSYPGVRGHPQIDPGILTRENVENWAKSIMEHTRNG